MENKIKYKSIIVSEPDDNICIFHMNESKLESDESVVIGLAHFTEYVRKKQPKYVIFDKLNSKFSYSDNISGYLKNRGIDILFNYGVQRIYFIVDKKRFQELHSSKGYRDITAYLNIESVLKDIKEYSLTKTINSFFQ